MLPIIAPDTARAMSLFAGLTEQEKDTLIKGGRIRTLRRGQMLFVHGDTVTHFYLVISGTIQLFRASPDGHQKTIAIVKSGQAICEDEIMDSCLSHRMNGMAVENTVMLEFPVYWLKDATKKYNSFALNLLSLIADRAHLAEVEAEHQATMSAPQRVACFLQRLCVLYNFNPIGFDLPYSKTLIASRLGMELETFSRALAKLKTHGITVQGNHIIFHNLANLGSYVCNVCSVSSECTTHQEMIKKIDRTPHLRQALNH